jgi:hypothetical protein
VPLLQEKETSLLRHELKVRADATLEELPQVLTTVLSQSLHGDEQSYHSLLSMQPRHRIALPTFVTRSPQ